MRFPRSTENAHERHYRLPSNRFPSISSKEALLQCMFPPNPDLSQELLDTDRSCAETRRGMYRQNHKDRCKSNLICPHAVSNSTRPAVKIFLRSSSSAQILKTPQGCCLWKERPSGHRTRSMCRGSRGWTEHPNQHDACFPNVNFSALIHERYAHYIDWAWS